MALKPFANFIIIEGQFMPFLYTLVLSNECCLLTLAVRPFLLIRVFSLSFFAGQPKGAMITNRNIASNAAGFRIHFEQVRSSFTRAQLVIDLFCETHYNS